MTQVGSKILGVEKIESGIMNMHIMKQFKNDVLC